MRKEPNGSRYSTSTRKEPNGSCFLTLTRKEPNGSLPPRLEKNIRQTTLLRGNSSRIHIMFRHSIQMLFSSPSLGGHIVAWRSSPRSDASRYYFRAPRWEDFIVA